MGYEIFLTLFNTLLILTLTIIFSYKRRFLYWKHRNVPYLEPRIPLGHSPNPLRLKKSLNQIIKETYFHFKSQNVKHCGIFTFFRPAYLPIDLECIKNILARDFNHFVDRGVYFNEKGDPLSAHLVSLEGDTWRTLRAKLTPTFTSGKMKQMFPSLIKCGHQMISAIEKMEMIGLDMKEVLGCFTTDVIGSCAFGLDCNSFKDAKSEFRIYCKKAMTSSMKGNMKRLFAGLFQKLAKAISLKTIDPDVTRFFLNVVKATVEHREKNNVRRNDFLQLLMELRKKDESVTINQMAAQCFVFFLAGFETSSTTMNFALYELATNQAIQDRAREEILNVLSRSNNEITYDSLKEMKYLDQIVDETLRLYPPAPILARVCTRDYQIPNTSTIIERGMRVFIGVQAIHMDAEFYPDPEKFQPERFTDDRKAERPSFTYLPFGEGPRICIGLRFGLMQSKAGLALLLKNYQFTVNGEMKPFSFNPRAFLLAPENPILLDARKL